jgi:hypothetical protein
MVEADFVACVTLRLSHHIPAGCAICDRSSSLRWVLLHLINETALHAGHADATRSYWMG